MNHLKRTKQLLMATSVLIASTSALASESQLVMKQCLANKIKAPIKRLAKQGQHQLISINDNQVEALRKLAHKVHCGGFLNVSHKFKHDLTANNAKELLSHYLEKKTLTTKANYQVKHQAQVNALIANIEPNRIWDNLTHFTSYPDRSATSDTGAEAANWVKATFDKMALDANRHDVKSYFVETGWRYKQPSVVTVMGADLPGNAVVLGAHIDTLSNNMPGADDDGSGTVSLMETARIMLNTKKLNHPVYFIWYAAEERGLVGSSYVVEDFLNKNIKVKAVLQFDMTGFRHNGEDKIWLLEDNVDPTLTHFVGQLATTYAGVDIGYTRCDYACSDHASWYQEGFAAACPFEAKFGQFNPYIHSPRDTMEHVSLEHMVNFSKIGIAFATELAQ